MKPGALDVSFRWSAQLGPGFVFYPEVEVPPGDVIGRGPLREDLEGALLSRDELAKPDDAEFVTVEDENAQIGFVTVVVGRVFFLGFRCFYLLVYGYFLCVKCKVEEAELWDLENLKQNYYQKLEAR